MEDQDEKEKQSHYRAGGFEPITPFPALSFMLLYCGDFMVKEKTATVRAHGCAGSFSSFGVCGNLNRTKGAGQ